MSNHLEQNEELCAVKQAELSLAERGRTQKTKVRQNNWFWHEG